MYVSNAELKEELFHRAKDAQACVFSGTITREAAFAVLEPCIDRIINAETEDVKRLAEYQKKEAEDKSRVDTVSPAISFEPKMVEPDVEPI